MAEDYCILQALDCTSNSRTVLAHIHSFLVVVRTFQISSLSPQERRALLADAEALQCLHHPCLLSLHSVCKPQHRVLSLVTEFAAKGSLARRLAGLQGTLMPQDTVGFLFAQICLGLRYLHESNRICGNLSTKRVFFTSESEVKIDFCANYKEKMMRFNRKMRLPPNPLGFLSPEVIEGSPSSFQSDIWALGELLYEMCALKPPFQGESLSITADLKAKGSFLPLPALYSQELHALVVQLLSKDPGQRPSVHKVLATAWVQGHVRNLYEDAGTFQKLGAARYGNGPKRCSSIG